MPLIPSVMTFTLKKFIKIITIYTDFSIDLLKINKHQKAWEITHMHVKITQESNYPANYEINNLTKIT